VRHDYPYYYDKFNDRILCIPGAKFCHSVAHVYWQTSNLASFMVEITTRFLSLMSKMIEIKLHVVTSDLVTNGTLSRTGFGGHVRRRVFSKRVRKSSLQ